ncbi:hypothetical protein SAMN05421820_107155 [Pedobacter steynii]|uniref:Type IV pilus biogenesis n=1 Tax=Pedobacter steynii TaxID=430522 RepID=A0A1H0AP78_9SPHI|nr:hypothetical protein [Pedobacter steynii]NQX41303.1 hypothetical protein [Pedobacter steynii]SDN35134.1 hypothetical protein SAMN05421820_107155 [Pedobacter steynii]
MQVGKNKKLTYLLICAVAVVWGVILYRVFFNQMDDDYEMKSQPVVRKQEPYDQYALKADTFKLALNYKDPFLGVVAPEPKVVAVPAQPVNFAPAPFKPQINWSSIKYSGYVVNPVTKKIVSIVVVNGKERMLSEGEFLEGVKLIKNKKDSILVFWQGKQKHIKQ